MQHMCNNLKVIWQAEIFSIGFKSLFPKCLKVEFLGVNLFSKIPEDFNYHLP